MRKDLKEQCIGRCENLLHKLNGKIDDDATIIQECFPGTVNLLGSIYGSESLQTRELLEAVKEIRAKNPYPGVMDSRIALILQGALQNLCEELNNGIIENILIQATGSTIADFLLLAEQSLDNSQKDVAAVLASASLEGAFKRKADEIGIDTEGKELADVINALKAKSFFTGPQHKVASSFVSLRNKAMHAEWARISPPEISSLIAFLKSFITEQFT
jgi:hypothetical protein